LINRQTGGLKRGLLFVMQFNDFVERLDLLKAFMELPDFDLDDL